MQFNILSLILFSIILKCVTCQNKVIDQCLNGGYYSFGKCICMPNFTGVKCEIEVFTNGISYNNNITLFA